MSLDDEVADAQRRQLQHILKTAEFTEHKATYESGAAHLGYKRAEVELKTAEAVHQRVVNLGRPSIVMGARIEEETHDGKKVYIATHAGLTAEGDTPEMAFSNFDHLWTQGPADAE